MKHRKDLIAGYNMAGSRLALRNVGDYEAADRDKRKGLVELENTQTPPVVDTFRNAQKSWTGS
jgi:hypothetical protein